MFVPPSTHISRPVKIDVTQIFFFVGVILCFLGLSMMIPMAIDLKNGSPDFKVFLSCGIITVFFGMLLGTTGYDRGRQMRTREVILTVVCSWISVTTFGSLPLMFSEFNLSITDAVFETMSGLTATGSTVIVGLDAAPKGLLLWRFILVWFGGFGVVTVAMLVLPFLRVGGLQLFSLDLSAQAGRFLPRMATVIVRIGMIYLGLTALCSICYVLAGMTAFDAIGHAMATVATGGFSSHDANIGYFNSSSIEVIASVFMLLSAMPFVLHLQVLRGQPRALTGDMQVRWFLAIVFSSIMVVTAWLMLVLGYGPLRALREATFNVSTLITCTGFTSQDFSLWGACPLVLFLALMVVGGCTGSTSGGIKIFRLCVLYANLKLQLRRQLFPHVSRPILYNQEPVPDLVRSGVVSYFFVYITTFFVLSLALSAAGLAFEESFSAAATAMGGVGPGFGPRIGPCCTFESISDAAKWLMVSGMLMGRLEILLVILPFTPMFWRD